MSVRHNGASKGFDRARVGDCGCRGWRAERNNPLSASIVGVGT